MTLLAVALGGALGAVSRFLVGGWVQSLAGDGLPWGTLSVNVIGSMMLGFLMVWLHASTTSAELRQFLVIGLLGSFTTFSTYSYETVTLIREGDLARAGAYALGSVIVGLLAVVIGAAIASGVSETRG